MTMVHEDEWVLGSRATWAMLFFARTLGEHGNTTAEDQGIHWFGRQDGLHVSLFTAPGGLRAEFTSFGNDDTTEQRAWAALGYCAYHKIPFTAG